MAHKPDEGYCVYGAGNLIRQVQAFNQEIEGVRLAKDIEFLHRMRVASRRLRTALAVFDACLPPKRLARWTKYLRQITQALGAARDTDVQIALLEQFYRDLPDPTYQPGVRRLLLRLRQRREKLQKKVLLDLDALETGGVLAEMQQRLEPIAARQEQTYLYTPFTYQSGFETIAAEIEKFLSYEEYIQQPERIEELHAMRIAAKHLRYTMEVFAPIYPDQLKPAMTAIRRVQEALGNIHDCDVWTISLPQFLEAETRRTQKYFGHTRQMKRVEPGVNFFLQDRQETREKTYQDFVAYWAKLKAQNTWQNLYRSLQIPNPLGEAPGAPSEEASQPDAEQTP